MPASSWLRHPAAVPTDPQKHPMKLAVLFVLFCALCATGFAVEAVIDEPRASLRLTLVEKYWRQGANDGPRRHPSDPGRNLLR